VGSLVCGTLAGMAVCTHTAILISDFVAVDLTFWVAMVLKGRLIRHSYMTFSLLDAVSCIFLKGHCNCIGYGCIAFHMDNYRDPLDFIHSFIFSTVSFSIPLNP